MPEMQGVATTPVVASYEFTRREYIATSFAVACLSAPVRITAAVGAAMVVVDLAFTLLGGSAGGLAIWGLLVLAWVGFCGLGIPRWRWRRDNLIRGVQTYTADNAGLRFCNAMADSTVAWSFYRRAVEYPTFYLLFEGRRGGTPILKRGFAGPDDEDRFRDLVAAHLPLNTRNR